MKKEWFEPGPDGASSFDREYRSLECAEISTRIASAFRALLAEEDAAPGELGKAVSVLEVERLTAELRACKDELMAAEIERDAADEFVKLITAERDALQVRIDGGRLMYGGMYGHEHDIEMWTFTHVYTDTMTARLIDVQPIEERKGEELVNSSGVKYKGSWLPFHDRRVNNGTRADRRAS